MASYSLSGIVKSLWKPPDPKLIFVFLFKKALFAPFLSENIHFSFEANM